MKNLIKKIKSNHRFFVTNSIEYKGKIIGTDIHDYPQYYLDFRSKLYYPIAYIKFMYISLK